VSCGAAKILCVVNGNVVSKNSNDRFFKTFEHVKIDSRKKLAELGQDVTAELNLAHDEATEKREYAQRRMKEHEVTHAESDGPRMD
jgi:hypothetical protein